MKVRWVGAEPEPALRDFERQFRYPLSSSQGFRIDHGDDYARFYRSLSSSDSETCLVAEDAQGVVVGACSAALRELHIPGLPAMRALYLGDLKVAPCQRGTRVLWHLARTLLARYPDVDVAYGVTMQGNIATPQHYTGRAGVPAFHAAGTIGLWCLSTQREVGPEPRMLRVSAAEGQSLFRSLAAHQCFSLSGDPTQRSSIPVQWWAAADGSSCGRLEDTQRAKKLVGDDGKEITAAHLSAFAYASPQSGERLLQAAIQDACRAGFPALWVSAPHGAELPMSLAQPDPTHLLTATQATVFATGLEEAAQNWNVFTAEI
jgi:hypothetical protein